MGIEIQAANKDNQKSNCSLIAIPDQCPICNQHGQPDFIYATTSSGGDKSLHAIFRCPVSRCRKPYIADYDHLSGSRYGLKSTGLARFLDKHLFPSHIEAISPLFCLTYNQALIAQENQLDQICGPGYRKALEFLVKDYLIAHLYKDDALKQEEVRKSFLAPAIEKHIDQDRIKQCAKRAVWLGNDQVHYTRKWEDKDISDLKSLILMTVNHIDLTIESDRYLQEMPGA